MKIPLIKSWLAIGAVGIVVSLIVLAACKHEPRTTGAIRVDTVARK